MGPRLVSRGDSKIVDFAYTVYAPSMGPRLVSRGDHQHIPGITGSGSPSMGPRLVSRGDTRNIVPPSNPTTLQWGRGL